VSEPPILPGPVDPRIAGELPGLGLAWCEFAVAGDVLRRSPPDLRARLRGLSDRARGSHAIALRTRMIPHAYRALFRHLGLEPDEWRVPVEELMLERLKRGAFPSRGLLPDALLVATVETEVGVWALDADRLSGSPGLALHGGRLAVADEGGVVSALFALPGEERAVTAATRRVALYAIVAPGVPEIAVEEALWTAWDVVDSG
jgi:DNA/RNA-binding domain of Phe-tRNA-synthetase-like protein